LLQNLFFCVFSSFYVDKSPAFRNKKNELLNGDFERAKLFRYIRSQLLKQEISLI